MHWTTLLNTSPNRRALYFDTFTWTASYSLPFLVLTISDPQMCSNQSDLLSTVSRANFEPVEVTWGLHRGDFTHCLNGTQYITIYMVMLYNKLLAPLYKCELGD